MITKPADAVPRMCAWDRKEPSGVIVAQGFTASECAEIARAYASALHASEFNSADAAIDAAKWESKFKEWETK